MAYEEDKSQVLQPRPVKPFSSLQNFSDYLEAQENRRKEDDRKGIEENKTFLAHSAGNIPIQIRLLQTYRANLKNQQLKPSYVQWLSTEQCKFHFNHGFRSHHDRIRKRPGDCERCLNCLQAFYDMDIPVIAVSIVVMDKNVHHIPKIIDDVYTHGGNRLHIKPLLFKKRNRLQIAKEALRQIYYARLKGFN